MTRERFEVIQREFKRLTPLMEAVACGSLGGNNTPLYMWGETIKALEEAWAEHDEAIMAELALTIEKDGMQVLIDDLRADLAESVKMADAEIGQTRWLQGEIDKLRSERDAAIRQRDERALRAAGLKDQMEYFRKGHNRYETARRLSPEQWADAWKLNISTGKPFDEIIDDLRPFVRPNDPLTGHIAANAAERGGL